MTKILLAAVIAAGLSLPPPPVAAANVLSPAQIAEIAIPSIVQIKVANGVGTGFAVADGGRIVTNAHVVRGAKEATIVTADGTSRGKVEVLAYDASHDLALLRVADLALKPLPLGQSAAAKPGQHVVAIGHPLGFGNTVSDGLVSAIRTLEQRKQIYLQISAPISPGSSGGPLFNDAGEVIGISTLVVNGGQNLNFAVPIDVLKPLLANEQGVALAEFVGWGVSGREVPKHADSLLDDCAEPEQKAVLNLIDRAIRTGAPLYNKGNIEACYRIYAAAALDADKRIKACPGPKRALLDGVGKADELEDWDGKAWAMRDAFDGLIELIQRRNAAATPAKPAAPDPRQPRHALSLLDDCSDDDLATIKDEIESAIDIGSPLYNDGSIEACYRIYEGAVDGIDRKVSACSATRAALREGSRNAEQRKPWDQKAWALRWAFDGVLEVIERRNAAAP